MEIAVLSDTHINNLEDLPKEMLEALSRVNLIVHAGDYTGKMLLNGLRDLGEFRGVYGNMDSAIIKSELNDVEVLEVGRFKIGVTHPSEGGSTFRLEEKVRKKFGQVDLIINGHSHLAKTSTLNGIIYLNPGSATGCFPAKYKSYGIIKIEKEIDIKIVRI